jgi:hypothetical protein
MSFSPFLNTKPDTRFAFFPLAIVFLVVSLNTVLALVVF